MFHQEPGLPLGISALRRRGKWRGSIFVITDQCACVPSTATAVALDMQNDMESRAWRATASNWHKPYKMRLLELLPLSPEHRFVLYLDMDVFVGRDDFNNFASRAMADMLASEAQLMCFREGSGLQGAKVSGRGKTSRLYHGGIFMLRRQHSEPCLAAWKRERYPYSTRELLEKVLQSKNTDETHQTTEKKKLLTDQPGLTKAALKGHCAVRLLPQYYFGQPAFCSHKI